MFKKLGFAMAAVLSMTAAPSTPAFAEEEDQIPLEAFTMLPMIQDARVSPDGKKLAVLRATSAAGNYIVDIYDTRRMDKEPVRLGSDKMQMQAAGWANSDRLYMTFRVQKERPNRLGSYYRFQRAIVDADGKGNWLELPEGSSLMSWFRSDKDEILLEMDANENRIPDVVRYNVNNGRTRTVIRGSTKISGFTNDVDGDIRGGTGFEVESGSIKYYARLKGDDDWELIKTITPDAETREDFDLLGFSVENPNEMYIRANNGEDKSGIYTYNLETKQLSERLFGLKSVDAGGIITGSQPHNLGKLLGYTYDSGEYKRFYTDPAEKALHDAVQALFPEDDVSLYSRSDDDNMIMVYVSSDTTPGTYYLLKNKAELIKIGDTYPLLDKNNLAEKKYIRYKARDGRTIYAYLTVPKGEGPYPGIVLPHGGPWVRETGGYDEWSQLLASRGYVVIQPNYRGSTGYGLDHWKAGDENWGLKMQDDLDDAAMYLVENGLSTKDELAMFGWSYGGYAAFAASMRDDNIYQCAVAGAGVSNLELLNAGLHNNPFLKELQRPTIKGVSPQKQVEKVNIPIFVVHGAIDERVPVIHSRQFVDELKKYGKDYKYTEMEGLDHFSNRFTHEHKKQFYTELLDWLASDKCFGK
ncbi:MULTISPECIES: alpha/beta hydrolase family protein [Kordiimonas]|jgi:dipeptidyl aminopeptidase/acylaminoacyl peptidase|uniref:alpha/beta hydrolase family protein n=1 Tax=Kordiimonas TaxID=288021 RepID=UPI002580E73A|nr:prolyl oligopeptidase family serine peptidase [Kordiimonas sp. UBA4487]